MGERGRGWGMPQDGHLEVGWRTGGVDSADRYCLVRTNKRARQRRRGISIVHLIFGLELLVSIRWIYQGLHIDRLGAHHYDYAPHAPRTLLRGVLASWQMAKQDII